MPENQIARNSNDQRIKEKINQNNQTGTPRQRNMAQRKEHSKTSELSDEEIANLSDVEFKALASKCSQNWLNLIEKWKITKEINQNIQGTNSDKKETRIQSNNLEQKEEINIQLDENEETRIQKDEEGLRNLWDNLKHSNTWIIGVPEGEEQQQ